MRRRFLILVPLIALFALAAIGLFRVRPPAELGKPPASFTLPAVPQADAVDEETAKITLDELVGRKPVVLNFWASWCEPCKDEAPEFRRAAQRWGDDVSFLGVTMLDGRGPASRFIERYEIQYPSVSDERGVTAKRFGVTGVPETIFIDADGIVVGRFIGAFTGDKLDDLVADLVDLEGGELLQITGRGETRPVP